MFNKVIASKEPLLHDVPYLLELSFADIVHTLEAAYPEGCYDVQDDAVNILRNVFETGYDKGRPDRMGKSYLLMILKCALTRHQPLRDYLVNINYAGTWKDSGVDKLLMMSLISFSKDMHNVSGDKKSPMRSLIMSTEASLREEVQSILKRATLLPPSLSERVRSLFKSGRMAGE